MNIVDHQLRQMSMAPIVRSENSRRMYYAGIQALPSGVEHQRGSLRLGFGVAALHQSGIKAVGLRHYLTRRLFGNGMNRADVDQLIDRLTTALLHQIARTFYIYRTHGGARFGGNRYDSGRVNDHCPFVRAVRQKVCHAFFVAHIPVKCLHTVGKPPRPLVPRQEESSYALSHIRQSTDDGGAQMPRRSRNKITHLLHASTPSFCSWTTEARKQIFFQETNKMLSILPDEA